MRLFLRLGATSFGGPAVHIALMEEEVVRRRAWLTRERFLDLLGTTNLIPGPNSTEMAIHVGYAQAGLAGLVVAGTAFALPAVLLTLGAAWAYVRFHSLPVTTDVLYGVEPVVIAVIAQALWRLGRVAVTSTFLAAVAVIATLATALGMHELVVLLGGGMLGAAVRTGRRPGRGLLATALTTTPLAAAALPQAVPPAVTSTGILLFFLKVGSVLFGSGYVLLAFLRADLVDRWHWLTSEQLLDAIAIGQLTPGPVFSAATFVGYLLAGTPGAVLATLGIFLPAFVFVALVQPLLPWLRRSAGAAGFLDGVNVASLALMLVVTVALAHAAVRDLPTAALAIGSAVVLAVGRVNPTWVVLLGAGVGILVRGG